MNESAVLIVAVILIVGSIFLMRLLGAWMLRINEVIELLQAILKELRAQKPKV